MVACPIAEGNERLAAEPAAAVAEDAALVALVDAPLAEPAAAVAEDAALVAEVYALPACVVAVVALVDALVALVDAELAEPAAAVADDSAAVAEEAAKAAGSRKLRRGEDISKMGADRLSG